MEYAGKGTLFPPNQSRTFIYFQNLTNFNAYKHIYVNFFFGNFKLKVRGPAPAKWELKTAGTKTVDTIPIRNKTKYKQENHFPFNLDKFDSTF